MRDGLRQDEVNKVASLLRRHIEDGTEPEVAFSLACREVVGVLPKAFAAWKEKIFEIAGGPKPEPTFPPGTTVFKRIELLEAEKEELKAENGALRLQVETLTKQKAELEKAFLEEDGGKDKKKTK